MSFAVTLAVGVGMAGKSVARRVEVGRDAVGMEAPREVGTQGRFPAREARSLRLSDEGLDAKQLGELMHIQGFEGVDPPKQAPFLGGLHGSGEDDAGQTHENEA